MVKTNSKQIQRWLAVSLLLAAIMIVSLIVIRPLINEGMALNETKNNLVFKLQQYERILARKDEVIASIRAIKEQYQTRGLLNSQTTGALASAEVQEFIKKAIMESGGQLNSTQALPLSTVNEFTRITVSVRMTGSSEVLRKVLYKIETSAPLIIINQIDIRPMRGSMNKTTRQIEQSNELNVNFQAVSFMRKGQE